MDPATVAGLVLGVLPLLISAAENYEITFQPFVTYRRHIREVEKFTARLDTQRSIFHNECQLLLCEVDQNLNDILGDPNHISRRDEQLSTRIQELLGSSCAMCISTLNLINDTLNEITTETKGFEDLLNSKVNCFSAAERIREILSLLSLADESDAQKSKGKSPLKLFRQKIKISFSKTRLNDIVNELRLYNSDIARLSSQIRRLGGNSVAHSSNTVNQAILTHLKVTQHASTRLYEALASKWSCDDRVEHIASMDLRVQEMCRQSDSKVRFNIGVSCCQLAHRPNPLWLAIESAPNDPQEDAQTAEHTAALEGVLGKMGASKPRVKFSFSASVQATSTPISRGPPQNLQLDLYKIGRLCKYFRQMRTQTSGEPCMGFLEKTKTFKHFVYSPTNAPSSRSNSQSLKEFLHSSMEGNKQQGWVEKLQLARLLSLAVLRFHSTPWLPESWSSKDVCLFSLDGPTQQDPILGSACINTQLAHGDAHIHVTEASVPSLATNKELFSLAIVLIELGHDAPFEVISQAEHPRVGTNKQIEDFLTARRLGESVHRKLNMTYGRLVEKCLNCNFGVATKLNDAELQSAVLIHVVNQLDVCLEQYRKFNSLAPIPI
jgi:hypothetical protein